MKAMRYKQFGGPCSIEECEIPTPKAGPGDLVIALAATSVNGADWKMGKGYLQDVVQLEFPFTVGLDFAGIVTEVGDGVVNFVQGDRVYGAVHFDRCGTYAETIAVPAALASAAPTSITLATAAVVPVASQTAWGALFLEDQGDLRAGETVLIHGGAGGVGSFAVQLAHWRGAYVIATASEHNHDYLCSLGADETIDYGATAFEDLVHDVDLVFDCVGGDLAARSVSVIREGGRLVSIAGPPPPEVADLAGTRGVRSSFFPGDPGGATLQKITDLIDAGTLRVEVSAEYPLAKAAEALAESERGHTRGKILLTIDPGEE